VKEGGLITLNILFKDGNEKECDGKVKFYLGEQPAFCHYDLIIENNHNPDMTDLKLVYDNVTMESVYFDTCSYCFYKGEERYSKLYHQSLRDIRLINKFKEYFEPFMSHVDFNDLDALAGIITRQEEEIINIYKIS